MRNSRYCPVVATTRRRSSDIWRTAFEIRDLAFTNMFRTIFTGTTATTIILRSTLLHEDVSMTKCCAVLNDYCAVLSIRYRFRCVRPRIFRLSSLSCSNSELNKICTRAIGEMRISKRPTSVLSPEREKAALAPFASGVWQPCCWALCFFLRLSFCFPSSFEFLVS